MADIPSLVQNALGVTSNNTPGSNFRNLKNYAKGVLIITPFGYKTTPSWAQPINFLLNPETMSESLQGGWIHKAVPGQNDPVSSWIGNGARTLSLTLLLIKDMSDLRPQNKSQPTIDNPQERTILGQIGAAVAKIPLPIFRNLAPKEPATGNSGDMSIDIADELDALRKLRYGEQYLGDFYTTPPSLVKFHFNSSYFSGNNIINPTLGVNGLDNVYWTVDSIEISVTKWSADAQPLQAEVKLSLVQFNDINQKRR